VDSLKRVEELCKAGARWITLKTGAYRPVDLSLPARAVTLASAGQAWSAHCRRSWRRHRPEPGAQDERGGIPLRRYLDKLAAQGEYIPAIALGGEGSPSKIRSSRASRFARLMSSWWPCQADGRARSPLAAARVAKNLGKAIGAQICPSWSSVSERRWMRSLWPRPSCGKSKAIASTSFR